MLKYRPGHKARVPNAVKTAAAALAAAMLALAAAGTALADGPSDGAEESTEESVEDTTVYLRFYTVDGEEIDDLYKELEEGEHYRFRDPDRYKYLPYENEAGDEVYPSLNEEITGLLWEELDPGGEGLGTYETGDTEEFEAGEHCFYVRTDSPGKTGENALLKPYEDTAHLFFMNVEGDELLSLQIDLASDDEYTFPDPADYAHRYEFSEEEGDYEEFESYAFPGNGIYWRCEDINDDGEVSRVYLFEADDTAKFRPGEYYFEAKTDDPVEVTFYYPMNIDVSDALTDYTPGDTYASMEAKIGDTITLKKSLGAIVYGCSFEGWEELNDYANSGKVFGGGSHYRLTSQEPLAFYALYEEDEYWDDTEPDRNLTQEELEGLSEGKEGIYVDPGDINEKAGAGYQAYIDPSTGKVTRSGGNARVNDKVQVKGITGSVKKESYLTTAIDKSEEAMADPSNYRQDKYGNKIEDSALPQEINNVLRQNDSAMLMDVYGNAFTYYSSLTRENNMKLALDRLSEGKTESWMQNVSSWDPEMVKRFEAVEFALLSGKYPEDGEEILPGSGVIWKDSYMSERAFNQLKPFKQLWTGWLDNYDDGLLQYYKETQDPAGGGPEEVSDAGGHRRMAEAEPEEGPLLRLGEAAGDAVRRIVDNLCLTAYAADADTEHNSLGVGGQIGARTDLSLDIKGVKFRPMYYDPSKRFTGVSRFSFSALGGLSSGQMDVLSKIFDALIGYGFTPEAAAGVCGNLWTESEFITDVSNGTYYGIVQWGYGRATQLLNLASEMGQPWSSVEVQSAMILNELDQLYIRKLNNYLSTYYGGSTMQTITDVEAAAEAWAVAYEGCICEVNGRLHTGHPVECGFAANGKSYQGLLRRKRLAQEVYAAMTAVTGGNGSGGSFAGMDNAQIISSIFNGCVNTDEVKAYYRQSELSAMQRSVPFTDSKGNARSITVNMYIAEDVAAALNEISENGFYLDNTTYGYVPRNSTTDKDSLSFHALGLAIDVNCEGSAEKSSGWAHNPQFRLAGKSNEWILANYQPRIDPLAVTTSEYNIFKSYGILWGRDFSSTPDLMHFVVGEVGQDGRHASISELCEGAFSSYERSGD